MRIHINDFENEIFERYNKLRELKSLPKIKEKRYLDIAISKILETIRFYVENLTSRTLRELEKEGIIECKNPKTKVSMVYDLAGLGKEIKKKFIQ